MPSSTGSGSKPIVGVTASGMPVVQIATPNGAGVSNNKYTSFNVGTQGLILNNSSTNVLTQQAGYITGNPNLTANGAQVILNQVLGGSTSQLLGYMEVAGQKADVIVANPAGIYCNGCGFINTNRGVLTTGTPVFGGSGSLDAFHVTGGQIQVGSSGLNASNIDQVDLIARSVQANGKIWADKTLNVVAGTNDVQYANLATTALTPDANHPTVAIDVAQLGGMYAGKIALVGTEAGVGVNSSGPIAAQAGDVTIDSQGQVTLAGATSASGNVSVGSATGIVNTGSVYAAQDAALTSQGQVGNSGTVAALGDATVDAASVDSTGTFGAGIDASGNATGAGSLSVSATGAIAATGTNLAGGDVALSGSSLNMAGGKTLAGGNATLVAASGDIDTGSMTAEGDLNATASGALNNNGGTLAAGGLLSTQSNTLTNTGTLVGGSVTLSAAQSILNQGPAALIGATDSAGTLALLAPTITNLDNSTTTDSAPTASIYGQGTVVLAGGKDVNGHYTNANQITNSSGLIQSAGDMTIAADQVTNTRTTMQTAYTATVDPTLLTAQGISLAGCTAIDMAACGPGNPEVGGYPVTDPAFATMIGGAPIDPPHGGHWNSTYQYTTYTGTATAQVVSAISPQGQIVSGGDLDAGAVGNFQNYWSAVTAVGNVAMPQALDQNSWQGQTAPQVTVAYSGQYHYDNYNNEEYNWQLPFGSAGFVTNNPGGYSAAPADVRTYALPSYESTFTANGTLSGTGVAINNVAGNAGVTPLGLPPSGKSITLPSGGLFSVDSAPNAPYLVQTNPAFTNQQTWLSSDYYFAQMGMDPSQVQMRLGDGYYEQQLVQQQILSLTGKSVLTNYASTQAEYEALMTSGAQLAQSLDLAPGTGLSPEQVAQLTSNVVIMQTEVVGGESVLVPVVYLAQASQQNMGNGPVIAATDVDLQNVASMANSGTIAASDNLTLSAQNLDSTNGTLAAGNQMALSSTGDVNLTSATVNAGSLDLQAGGNLVLDTSTQTLNQVSPGGATRSTTTLGPVVSINVANDATIATGGNFEQDAGNLNVGGALGMNIGGDWTLGVQQTGETKTASLANGTSATHLASDTGSQVNVGGASQIAVGGDLTATGAQINLAGGGTLAAQGDVNLQAATATTTLESNSSGSDGHGSYADARHTSDDTVTGTALTSGSDLTIAAGKDLNVTGSSVNLVQGTATLAAQGNVNIGAASETHVSDAQDAGSHSGILSSTSRVSTNDTTQTLADGSAISADTVNIQAGKDLAIQGSSVVGTKAVNLAAAGNVAIEAATNTQDQSSYTEEQTSGLMGSGGIGFTIGSRQQSENDLSASTMAVASTVGAVDGNVSITAGNQYSQVGSNVIAPSGDIAIQAKQVDIVEARESYSGSQESKFEQSGLTVALSTPVLAALQTVSQMAQAASQTSDARMQALAAGASALTLYNNAGAFNNLSGLANASSMGQAAQSSGVSVSITVGGSHSDSLSTQTSNTGVGSTVAAGGNVDIEATGAGQDSNLRVQGSDVSAGGNVSLKADNQVELLASQNTSSERSTNSSSSAAVGVAVSVGSNGGPAFGVTASASLGKGHTNSDDLANTNTNVTAGDTLTIDSGGDTTLKGAVASGKQVVADVGGSLTLQSLQDTSTYDGSQMNIGGSITVGYGASGSLSYSDSSANGDYASVTDQTGIKAGDGGFQIDVQGNTGLQGAAIASSQSAVEQGRNSLTTGTLTTSDIANYSNYGASGINLSGGYSVSTGGQGSSGQKGTAASTTDNGATWSAQNFTTGAQGAAAGYSSESGNQSSTTRSGISGGAVTITDAAAQQAATGQTADQAVASLNRDITSTSGSDGLTKTWNGQQLQQEVAANAQIMAVFGQQASKAVGDYAQEQLGKAAALLEQAKQDPTHATELRAQAYAIEMNWGGQGVYDVAAHAVIGGLTGGVGGVIGAATSATLSPWLISQVSTLGPMQQAAITGMVVLAGGGAASVLGQNPLDAAAAAGNQVQNNDLRHFVFCLLCFTTPAAGGDQYTGGLTDAREALQENTKQNVQPLQDPVIYIQKPK